jgi:peptide/nickel transport system permease protein
MVRFVIKRAAQALVTLVLMSSIVFFLVDTLIPYTYATQFWFGGGLAAVREATERLGLDRPVMVRYVDYMSGLATGSLGESLGGTPVTGIISAALPTTLLIFVTGGILAYLLGGWLGRFAEWRLGRLGKTVVSAMGLSFFTAFPPWLVFLLVTFGAPVLYGLRRALDLPADSLAIWRSTLATEDQIIGFLGVSLLTALIIALATRAWARRQGRPVIAILALPAALAAVCLAVARLGIGTQAFDVFFFRVARGVNIGRGSPVLGLVAFILLAFGEVMFVWRVGVVAEKSEDYVLTARAKGISERLIRDRHVARNALLPVLSRSFTALPYMLAGLIIIEHELALGGLSSAFFAAVQSVDTPVIIGVLVALGVLTLGARFVLDLVQASLDPRIRLEGGR